MTLSILVRENRKHFHINELLDASFVNTYKEKVEDLEDEIELIKNRVKTYYIICEDNKGQRYTDSVSRDLLSNNGKYTYTLTKKDVIGYKQTSYNLFYINNDTSNKWTFNYYKNNGEAQTITLNLYYDDNLFAQQLASKQDGKDYLHIVEVEDEGRNIFNIYTRENNPSMTFVGEYELSRDLYIKYYDNAYLSSPSNDYVAIDVVKSDLINEVKLRSNYSNWKLKGEEWTLLDKSKTKPYKLKCETSVDFTLSMFSLYKTPTIDNGKSVDEIYLWGDLTYGLSIKVDYYFYEDGNPGNYNNFYDNYRALTNNSEEIGTESGDIYVVNFKRYQHKDFLNYSLVKFEFRDFDTNTTLKTITTEEELKNGKYEYGQVTSNKHFEVHLYFEKTSIEMPVEPQVLTKLDVNNIDLYLTYGGTWNDVVIRHTATKTDIKDCINSAEYKILLTAQNSKDYEIGSYGSRPDNNVQIVTNGSVSNSSYKFLPGDPIKYNNGYIKLTFDADKLKSKGFEVTTSSLDFNRTPDGLLQFNWNKTPYTDKIWLDKSKESLSFNKNSFSSGSALWTAMKESINSAFYVSIPVADGNGNMDTRTKYHIKDIINDTLNSSNVEKGLGWRKEIEIVIIPQIAINEMINNNQIDSIIGTPLNEFNTFENCDNQVSINSAFESIFKSSDGSYKISIGIRGKSSGDLFTTSPTKFITISI